jgi:hypothetical protein
MGKVRLLPLNEFQLVCPGPGGKRSALCSRQKGGVKDNSLPAGIRECTVSDIREHMNGISYA